MFAPVERMPARSYPTKARPPVEMSRMTDWYYIAIGVLFNRQYAGVRDPLHDDVGRFSQQPRKPA
jgi:hypothetical protein